MEQFTIKNTIVFVVVGFFIFLAFGIMNTDSTVKDPNAWKSRDNSSMAYVMMERFVKKNLKAPRTAKFPGVFAGKLDHVTSDSNQTYRVSSYVDSQNGFGALIRTKFVGTIKQIIDNGCNLISLYFN